MAQESYDEPSGWVGWIGFAAVIMIIGGTLAIFQGFVAAFNDDWVVWGNQGSVYIDLSQWGWIHMILGTAVLLSGFGVLTGNVLARTVGVVVATLSLIANFMFIPVYPIWAITVIVVDMLVIWALTAHGAEMKE